MSSFIIPRTVFYGSGTIKELANLKGNKASVVVGAGSIRKNGAMDRILGHLEKAGFAMQVIEVAGTDPTTTMVAEGTRQMAEFSPDLIVAAGGGSPIDAAKAMWLFYEYPSHTFQEAVVPFTLPPLRQKARFVAIPTTSGTATEVTSFSVITDAETLVKYPIADYNLTPDIAIVDCDLVVSMPPELTAHTGMDAFTHAIEAYVSTMATDLTDALAMKAIEIINSYLPGSYAGSKKAREKMHLAQCMAGMAFSNAILGIVHSMSHKSGKLLDIPHGCANAIFLPHVIAFNAEKAPGKYADIARRTGLLGTNEKDLVKSLVLRINELNRRLGIPLTLMEYGINEDFFNHNLDEMAAGAVGDPCSGTNPRPVSTDEMRELFRLAFYGS
ncbi:MAG: iron-containing alcohol dehydrogenase [Oxalobacter sp.]|nr:iron-containing alcohol dehydrogenase [Oxalobacter sp.]